jgi:hypothetical protein
VPSQEHKLDCVQGSNRKKEYLATRGPVHRPPGGVEQNPGVVWLRCEASVASSPLIPSPIPTSDESVWRPPANWAISNHAARVRWEAWPRVASPPSTELGVNASRPLATTQEDLPRRLCGGSGECCPDAGDATRWRAGWTFHGGSAAGKGRGGRRRGSIEEQRGWRLEGKGGRAADGRSEARGRERRADRVSVVIYTKYGASEPFNLING